jgi:hypothetical protein
MRAVSSIINAKTGFGSRPVSMRSLFQKMNVNSLALAFAAYDINDRYRRSGGSLGRLGIPMGELSKKADGSFQRNYQLGNVTKQDLTLPPIGMTDYIPQVVLAAVRCFGTFSSFPSNTDSTYAVISLVSIDPNAQGSDQLVKTMVTPIEENVKAGSIILQGITIGGIPITGLGILIHVALWRHVNGDKDKIKDQIHKALVDAVNQGAAAIAGAASSAENTSTAAGWVGDASNFKIGDFKPVDFLTLEISELIANMLADKLIDQHTYQIPPANLAALADDATMRASIRTSPDLSFDIQLNWPPKPEDEYLFSGGGGSYKAYFLITTTTEHTPLPPPLSP